MSATPEWQDGCRAVILNRGPHGPPGGNLQVLGRNTEHLGNWGGMDPFGGNQQIAINSPGCSSGWRIVAASPVFVDVTLRPEGSSAMRGYRFFSWVIGTPPPPTAVCNFVLLVDLPRALQQFGSAPEIPVRNRPSECTKPPLLNPGSAPERITTGHSAQTKMDTGPMKDNIFGSEAFILLTKMEMHALPAQRISKFPSKFGS